MVLAVVAVHALAALALGMLKYVNPPITGVQLQRGFEAITGRTSFTRKRTFAPLARIAPDLQHAVIAAEDGRFYEHHGIDWLQVRKVAEESRESGEIARGASTITQQLVKNLFFTTHRNPFRKVFEYTLAPMASVILGKRRVLELYLNIVEWGPGVWGAEAAAAYHFNSHANRLTREQSSRLAACLPNPRRRRPAAMNRYSAIIEGRMSQLGW